MSYKWKPSKAAIEEFKQKLIEQENQTDLLSKEFPEIFFKWNNNMSSLYFKFENKEYRISTHHLPNRNIDNDYCKYRNYNPLLNDLEVVEIVTNSRDNIFVKTREILKKGNI